MDLPSEVRLQILREVLGLQNRRFYLSGMPVLKRSCHALLLNRQIRREASTIMYGDPVWRIVKDRFSWKTPENTCRILRRLQHSGELALVRKFRFEFDLDSDQAVHSLTDLAVRVNAAYSGMGYCCDLLAQAGAPLHVEIAWVDHIPFRTWEATRAILHPLSRLLIKTITITQPWKCPRATSSRRSLAPELFLQITPSRQQFAEYLMSITRVTQIWSLSWV